MAKYPGAFIINEVGTRKDLASLYGVSERTIYRWLAKASKESGLTPKAKATRPRPSTLVNFKGTRKQLAKKYGVSERTAYRWLAQAKAKGSQIPSRQNISKYPGAETIANQVLGGKTNRQIAEDYNVSRSTASRWVRKARLETGEPLPRGRRNMPRPLTPDTAPTDEDIFNEQDTDAYSPENMIEPPEFEPEEIFEEPIEDTEATEDFSEFDEWELSNLNEIISALRDSVLTDDHLFNTLTPLEQARYIDAYLKWQYGKDEHQFYDESTHRMMYDPDSPEMTSPAFISNLDLWGEDFEDWLQWQFDNDIYEV